MVGEEMEVVAVVGGLEAKASSAAVAQVTIHRMVVERLVGWLVAAEAAGEGAKAVVAVLSDDRSRYSLCRRGRW